MGGICENVRQNTAGFSEVDRRLCRLDFAERGGATQVELYDHLKDPEENENVAARHPELVEKLLSKLSRLKQKS